MKDITLHWDEMNLHMKFITKLADEPLVKLTFVLIQK